MSFLKSLEILEKFINSPSPKVTPNELEGERVVFSLIELPIANQIYQKKKINIDLVV